MRSTNTPPDRRANSQLNNAVRAPPTCRYPVGDGAKRTRGEVMERTRVAVTPGVKSGGEAGIRTLGTTLRSYNGLANRRLRPLGHLTARPQVYDPETLTGNRSTAKW